jgi:hypothetical protein
VGDFSLSSLLFAVDPVATLSNCLDLAHTMDFDFQGPQNSSPVQDNDDELKASRLNKLLISKRNELLKEIEVLEIQWNELQDDEHGLEEDNLILELLQDINEEEIEEIEEIEEVEEGTSYDRYSTKPITQWPVRLEYLKRFYPYLSIDNISSKLSLQQIGGRSLVIKTISFSIEHHSIFAFDLSIQLISKSNSYSIHDLKIEKKSMNKFNTVLNRLQKWYQQNKNINGFLYDLNRLYELIKERQMILQELTDLYTDGIKISMYRNEITIKGIIMIWDLLFDQSIQSIVSLSQYNDQFKDMVDRVGVKKGLEMIIEEYLND